MARGPKKHLKRIAAPKHWMLSKLGGIFAPRPSSGPHKLRECLPLTLILRNRLKYALTRREVIMIVNRRYVKVDGKVRTDPNYPAGFMDVVSIDKAARTFRLLYNTTGHFVLHKVNDVESKYKLCKVTRKAIGAKAFIGRNPLRNGHESSIPYITTHDGRTIRYVDPLIKVNDTVKIDIETGKIVDFIKFGVGAQVMSIRGNNIGRVGTITHIEYHPGSFDIVHVKDVHGSSFVTRLSNVFAVGTSESLWISLPSDNGIKRSAIENRERVLKLKARN